MGVRLLLERTDLQRQIMASCVPMLDVESHYLHELACVAPYDTVLLLHDNHDCCRVYLLGIVSFDTAGSVIIGKW